MFKIRYLIFLTIISFTFISLTACSDDTTSGVTEQEAVIQGSVENSGSQNKDLENSSTMNSTVVAGTVTSDGSLELFDETRTEVNASGEFTISVDVNRADNFIFVAETAGGELKGFISSEINNGQSYTLKNINSESTAEARVFMEIVSSGSAETVQKSDIELIVRQQAAAEIEANSSAAAEFAAAVQNYAETRAQFFAEFTDGNAQAMLNSAYELMAEAQFEYESNVSGSVSGEQKEAAFEALIDAKVNAYTEAGFKISTVANYLHMQAEIIESTLADISAEAKNEVRKSSSLYASVAIDLAAQASSEAAGVSQATLEAIADAGIKLRASLQESNGERPQMEESYETHRNEVRVALESEGSAEATIILSVDLEINLNGGVKSDFKSSLNGIISIINPVDVYATFFNAVESEVASQTNGEMNVEAISELIVVINLFS